MALLTSRSSRVFVDLVTNHVTVGKYIKYLCNAFVFYDIKRYDIRGKKYLESSEKFYLCDSGIRYAILGSRNMDYGRVVDGDIFINPSEPYTAQRTYHLPGSLQKQIYKCHIRHYRFTDTNAELFNRLFFRNSANIYLYGFISYI